MCFKKEESWTLRVHFIMLSLLCCYLTALWGSSERCGRWFPVSGWRCPDILPWRRTLPVAPAACNPRQRASPTRPPWTAGRDPDACSGPADVRPRIKRMKQQMCLHIWINTFSMYLVPPKHLIDIAYCDKWYEVNLQKKSRVIFILYLKCWNSHMNELLQLLLLFYYLVHLQFMVDFILFWNADAALFFWVLLILFL